jgi:hypothetical protein
VVDFYAELRLVTCTCTLVLLYLVTKSPSTGKYWREYGLEKTESCNHTGVLMIVCYCCVSPEQNYFILGIKNTMECFLLKLIVLFEV